MKAPFRSIALLAATAALTLSACADPQAIGDIKASVERLEAQQKDVVTKLEGLEKSNKEILAKAGTGAAAKPNAPDPNKKWDIVIGDSYTKGPKNAAVTIVEWSDFQCPFCKKVQPTLERLRTELNLIERASNLGLPTVVNAILVTEQFHEAVLAVFQAILWWATQHSSKPVEDMLGERSFRRATDRCRETALLLRQFREGCDRIEVREAIKGFASFACMIDRATTSRLVVDEVLRRHHQVQSGKVDGGVPKRDWVSFDGGRILCPSPRFQRKESPNAAIGKTLTHPYRLESFIYMLRENNVLSSLT